MMAGSQGEAAGCCGLNYAYYAECNLRCEMEAMPKSGRNMLNQCSPPSDLKIEKSRKRSIKIAE